MSPKRECLPTKVPMLLEVMNVFADLKNASCLPFSCLTQNWSLVLFTLLRDKNFAFAFYFSPYPNPPELGNS